MKEKNNDQDRWYSGIRSPYERVFSQQNKRVRYCGIAKNQFAAFMEAICFNLKRLTVLDPPHLAPAWGSDPSIKRWWGDIPINNDDILANQATIHPKWMNDYFSEIFLPHGQSKISDCNSPLEEALRETANNTEYTVLSDALNALIDKCVAIRELNLQKNTNPSNKQTFWNPNAVQPERAINGLLTAAMIRTYLLVKAPTEERYQDFIACAEQVSGRERPGLEMFGMALGYVGMLTIAFALFTISLTAGLLTGGVGLAAVVGGIYAFINSQSRCMTQKMEDVAKPHFSKYEPKPLYTPIPHAYPMAYYGMIWAL